MDKQLFDDIVASLQEAAAITRGETAPSRVFTYEIPDVKEIRTKTGLSQIDPTTGNINLIMPGNVTFAYNDTTINPSFYQSLNQLAATMNQYNETSIVVVGHTDSDGSDSYNLDLSQRRAAAVKNYLVAQGVQGYRIQTMGYGESRPVANNATAEGRAQNRRVELTINAPQSLSN